MDIAAVPLEELMEHLAARDRAAALALVGELRDGGMTAEELISGLLAPAQERVGMLWQLDTWDVAQEHLATGIIDAALAEIERHNEVVPLRGSVVISCAEGEWHVLPARMHAEQLRRMGWSVTFLGGSTPAGDLTRFLPAVDPVAVGISCSMSSLLPGAQRSIAAIHELGLPVVAGGAGFGSTERRAVSLGADGWASSTDAADRLLTGWSNGHPSLRSSAPSPAVSSFVSVRAEVLEQAQRRLATDGRHDIVTELLQLVEAALLTDDPTVLSDFASWLDRMLRSRGGAGRSVAMCIDAIDHALPPGHHQAREQLRLAASALAVD